MTNPMLSSDLTYGRIRWLWLRDRRVWLLSGFAAAGVGVALNWGWLSAIGVAPILLSVLPCLAMCGAGLCMCKGLHGSRSTPDDEKPEA
ncbi:MAG: hypothetical protein RIB84_18530 [Sneathiellaceae bacterium]